MAVSKGLSIVWGVSTTALTGFSAAATSPEGYIVTGEDWETSATLEEIKNGSGETAALYWYDYKKVLNLKCFPSASATNTATAVNVPEVGEKVIVTSGDANIAGTYLCTSHSNTRKQDGILEFDIELTQWAAIDESTAAN